MKDQTLLPLYNKDKQSDLPHPPPQGSQDGTSSAGTHAHARRV